MFPDSIFDEDISRSHSRCYHKGTCFNTVLNNCMFSTMESFNTFNHECFSSSTFDVCSHLVKKEGQVNNFWFTRSIFNGCNTISQSCCHHKVLSGTNRWEVHINRCTFKVFCRRSNVTTNLGNFSTHCF